MSEDGTEQETADRTMQRRARRAVLTLAAVLVAYYAAPVGELPSNAAVALSVLGLIAGLGLLVRMTVRQVRRLAGARPDDEGVRVESLIFLIYIVVPLFALGYFALESADPSQFDELTTKTDALYFTVSTLATVGFGDVHATDQLSRILVTIQIAFDLVFVGALVTVLTGLIRQRATTRRAERAAEDTQP
jgi:voltage-gated potassium channel